MPDEDRHTKPLADWLTQQRKGALNVEGGEALVDLINRVKETRKGGSLVIEIKVAPGPGNSLKVSDDLKLKLPSHDREIALWFADESGLTRRDPDQPDLPFPFAVPDGVDAETGEVTKEKKQA